MGVMKLEHYQFSQEHNEMIVKAMVDGYQEYVDLRLDLSKKMAISSAFAWTKENFIESEVAKVWKANGFTVKRSKAGPTWDYLQFINNETNSLFLIKNASYFNQPGLANSRLPIPGGSERSSRTYLQELAKINKGIEFRTLYEPDENDDLNQGNLTLSYAVEAEVNEQLALFRSEYDSFHILTYQLDRTQQIDQIMHYLPNPANNMVYLLEDLTDYLTGNELTEEERTILAPDHESVFEPGIYDLDILEED